MTAKKPFLSRTVAVIADLSLDEQIYLYEKTRQLKQALQQKDQSILNQFRINDPDLGIYEVFLEDSTRTKESFRNAAEFHRARTKIFDATHSSFNKQESYSDAFNMLIGYENAIFVIRSKLEGVCRWLEYSGMQYASRMGLPFIPAFVNAGDGKHEHPTQELLDEFSFLEDNQWDRSHIHIALVGDLFHGRTTHSKVDGLKLFREVEVDLVAPPELEMPAHYIERMKSNGFQVRVYHSVREYLAQKHVATKFYFGRAQLERMGEDVLRRQAEFLSAIDITEEDILKLPHGTGFYHPLPRNKEHPIPHYSFDNSPYNRYEPQSRNGWLVRIILTGGIAGVLIIGQDFEGQPLQKPTYIDDFIEEVVPHQQTKDYAEGIKPLSEGIVIDHICKGETDKEIREHMARIIQVIGLYGRGGEWVSASKNQPGKYKGIIFRPGYQEPDERQTKKIAAVAPGCTLNIVHDGRVVKKLRLNMPPRIYGFDEISCKNEDCISNPQHHEGVPAEFYREGGAFVCRYCESPHTFKQVWD